MIRIAVTGGIACGKSLVTEFMAARGVPILSADAVAHGVMRPGHTAFADIVGEFGELIVGSDGEIDRGALGQLVFKDPGKRHRLEDIVHPTVCLEIARWLDERGRRGVAASAVEIPLLFEAALEQGWDAVVCVVSCPRIQRRRLASRGFAAGDVAARVEAQMGMVAKARRSDYVVVNNGARELAREQTDRVLRSILRRDHGRTRK